MEQASGRVPSAQHRRQLEPHIGGEATWKTYKIAATAEQLPVIFMLLVLAGSVFVPPLQAVFF